MGLRFDDWVLPMSGFDLSLGALDVVFGVKGSSNVGCDVTGVDLEAAGSLDADIVLRREER